MTFLGKPVRFWQIMALGIIIGAGTSLNAWIPSLLVAGVITAMVLYARGTTPLVYLVITLVALGSDGWDPGGSIAFNPFRIQISRIYAMEFFIYGLIAVRMFLWLRRRTTVKLEPSVRLPLILAAVFCALMPFSAILGVAMGNDIQEALGYGEWRALFMAGIAYIAIVLERPGQATLNRAVWFAFWTTVARGVFGSAKYLLGYGDYHPGIGSIVFIDSTVLILMSAFVLLAVCTWALDQFRAGGQNSVLVLFGLLPMVFSLVASLRRNIWLGLLIGLCGVLLWLPPKQRGKLTLAGLVAAGFSVIGLFLFNNELTGSIMERVQETLGYILNPTDALSIAESNTLPFHLYDLLDGWNYVLQSPWIGHGFGAHYPRVLTALQGVMGEEVSPNFIHNQYLHLWLKMGVLGFLTYVSWVAVVLVRTVRAAKQAPPSFERSLLTAIGSFLLAQIAMQMWNASLIGQTKMPLIFASVMAVATVTAARLKEET